MEVQEKTLVDLDKLTDALVNLDPKTHPDYTNDWPIEELKNAIKEGDNSEDSSISTADEHLKYFESNHL